MTYNAVRKLRSKKGCIEIKGKVLPGTGKGTEWVNATFPHLFAGTLNIELDNYKPEIQYHTRKECQNPKWSGDVCLGNCLLNGYAVQIILPPEYKFIKRKNLLEIAHPNKLRDALNLQDGDIVIITFTQGGTPVL